MKTPPNTNSVKVNVGLAQRDDEVAPHQLTRRGSPETYLLVALMLWEFCTLLAKAVAKPLWYDELVTLHVSGLRPFSRLWSALKAGVDGTPPAYYFIVQTVRRLPGDPHLLVRVPSIFGYLLTLFAVFWITRRRRSAAVSLAAVALLSLSPFREYAVEARPYGLIVGLLASAAVLWTEVDHKRYSGILLSVILALAVSCHYFVIVALAIFFVAEAAFTLESRRVRWRVWFAVLFAGVPFLIFLPGLLRFGHAFAPHFWSRTSWSDAIRTYQTYLPLDLTLSLALLMTFAMVLARFVFLQIRSEWSVSSGRRTTRVSEMVLIAGFMFYPAMLAIITRLLHSVYTPRYGSPAVFGLVLGLVYFLRLPRIASKFAVFALLVVIGLRGIQDFMHLALRAPEIDEPWSQLAAISRRAPELPVVIGSGLRFLEATEYSEAALRPRLVELIDEASAVRFVGTDTVEKTNLALAQFVPLATVEPSSFEATHNRFILYSTNRGLDWVTPYLLNTGYHLSLLAKVDADAIYLAAR